jgi:hypothetical protein
MKPSWKERWMPEDRTDMSKAQNRERTPGAAGHPEPGSGHDDSKTVTVEDGPPRRFVDGVPGADGEEAAANNMTGNVPAEPPVER